MSGPDINRDLERHGHLLAGLLSDDQRLLYLKSARFHASIEVLTQLLPLFVDGLAADAERKADDMAAALAVAMGHASPAEPVGGT